MIITPQTIPFIVAIKIRSTEIPAIMLLVWEFLKRSTNRLPGGMFGIIKVMENKPMNDAIKINIPNI